MDIINVAEEYPNTSYHALLPALLEHEGHYLTVERTVGGGNGYWPEIHLCCKQPKCAQYSVLMVLRLPMVEDTYTLTFTIRGWFPGDTPTAEELAVAIDEGLHRDWHDPDSGEWWLSSVRAIR